MNGWQLHRATLYPLRSRTLVVMIKQPHHLAARSEMRCNIGRDRGFATTALGIGDKNSARFHMKWASTMALMSVTRYWQPGVKINLIPVL